MQCKKSIEREREFALKLMENKIIEYESALAAIIYVFESFQKVCKAPLLPFERGQASCHSCHI